MAFETFSLGDFEFDHGRKIRSLKLAYATFGLLSAKKDGWWASGLLAAGRPVEAGYASVGARVGASTTLAKCNAADSDKRPEEGAGY